MQTRTAFGIIANVRLLGVSAAVGLPDSFRRGGVNFNPATGGGYAKTASVPDGYRHPSAYVPGISDGGLSSRVSGSVSSSVSIVGAGVITGNAAGTTSINAAANQGRQISGSVSGAASSSVSIEAIGQLASTLRIGASPSAIDIADQVWSRQMSPFNEVGTFGYKVKNLTGGGGGGGPTAEEVAQAVWDEPTSAHTTSGSFGWWVKKLLSVGKFLGLK